jgi:hypothetical protein
MYLRLFLKVCEGCGVLWFRAHDCTDIYCSRCARKMRTLPPVRLSRRPGRRGRQRCAGNTLGGAA